MSHRTSLQPAHALTLPFLDLWLGFRSAPLFCHRVRFVFLSSWPSCSTVQSWILSQHCLPWTIISGADPHYEWSGGSFGWALYGSSPPRILVDSSGGLVPGVAGKKNDCGQWRTALVYGHGLKKAQVGGVMLWKCDMDAVTSTPMKFFHSFFLRSLLSISRLCSC